MLNLKSLREQVYQYLRDEMQAGRLKPGAIIDLAAVARTLGISKTPLREALIQLEAEGFVQNLPRRGVRVAVLSLKDVRNLYEIIGTLEAGIIQTCHDQLRPDRILMMEQLNERMRRALAVPDFDRYYHLNLRFHGAFVELTDNDELKRMISIMKLRLYDFPRRSYLKDWELGNCQEHDLFIEHLKEGRPAEAARVMRDVHWSYRVQEAAIRRFYGEGSGSGGD